MGSRSLFGPDLNVGSRSFFGSVPTSGGVFVQCWECGGGGVGFQVRKDQPALSVVLEFLEQIDIRCRSTVFTD